MSAIPLQLVTGFLGSGKTTFLKNYLEEFSGSRRIGIIQNEYSSVNVDSLELSQLKPGFEILEVNNGSVFCVCLLGSFIESLALFIDQYNPDEVLMEASGMSDPVSIGQIFQSAKLRGKVYMGYSWTIVDALNFEKVTAIRSRLEHQIRIADTVIVNKSDLAGDKIESVIASVKKINPFAIVEKSSFAQISFNGKKNLFKFFPAEASLESCRPDLQSVVIKSSRIIDSENLTAFINSVKANFIRCKGYVNTGKDQKTFVQGIFDEYTFNEVEWFHGVTEFVGIGRFDEGLNFDKIFETYCK